MRYFAAVRAAAGVGEEQVDAGTLGEALDAVRRDRPPRFAEVLGVCAYVVDGDPAGTRDPATVVLGEASVVECLPPFAGG